MSTVAVPEMKQVNVPQVVLILGMSLILMAGVVILAVNNKDVGAILGAVAAVGLGVAAAFGMTLNHKVDQVKEMTNGRMTEVMADNKALNEKVAALSMLIQPPDLPSSNDHVS